MELPTLNLKKLEELAIDEAMRQAGSRVAKAAKLLGIGRATLYRRLGHRATESRAPDTHEEEQ